MVIYPPHTSRDGAHIISELCHPGLLATAVVWSWRQIAAVVVAQILGGGDLSGSWASVNIFDLINTEMWGNDQCIIVTRS